MNFELTEQMKIKYYRHLDLEREVLTLTRRSRTLRIAEGYFHFSGEQVLGCLIAHINRSDIRLIRDVQGELERGLAKYEALQTARVEERTAGHHHQSIIEEFLKYKVPRVFYERDKQSIALREALMNEFQERNHMAVIGYVQEIRYADHSQTSVVESLGKKDQKKLEQVLRKLGFGARISFPLRASYLFS